jgi:hypothetical protein
VAIRIKAVSAAFMAAPIVDQPVKWANHRHEQSHWPLIALKLGAIFKPPEIWA